MFMHVTSTKDVFPLPLWSDLNNSMLSGFVISDLVQWAAKYLKKERYE